MTGSRFAGKAVVITGGTMGIGLATGVEYGRRGARVALTYKWGSADEQEVRRAFAAADAPEPLIVQADAASGEDTLALFQRLRQDHERIEVYVSNVSAAQLVHDVDDYEPRSLFKTIEYSAWPTVDGLKCIKKVFGAYPRYAIGLSSAGPDRFVVNYDFMAASKSVLETLCRYLNYRLYDEDLRINVVRAGMVKSQSLMSTLGEGLGDMLASLDLERYLMSPETVARAIVALTSGEMDGVSGQVINVDRGFSFHDNFMRLYQDRLRGRSRRKGV